MVAISFKETDAIRGNPIMPKGGILTSRLLYRRNLYLERPKHSGFSGDCGEGGSSAIPFCNGYKALNNSIDSMSVSCVSAQRTQLQLVKKANSIMHSLKTLIIALLVFVCAIVARPMIQLDSESNDDVYHSLNVQQLPVGYHSSTSNSPILQSENNSILPLPLRKDRFKRNTVVQNHNGIRYNGITIKLPEGDGLANSLVSSSTEKPRTKPGNRLTRIHIRIG
ncbi:uncharacterized protein LOC130686149 [Daphnia carinata]|uniref:uncharacterized protein LOC130686149 n=1 Tax=Daphnia carinata TaxID=120202 RepID=UPI0028688E5E|nr:uncharacterized protein LOC130686149 [Daphnia carinata]XP_059353638.1 uncharacterized protein LOC130686149 [Daphnia carinata]